MLPFRNKNRVTSPFGTRTLNGNTCNHSGLDIVGVDSTDIRAVCGGKVIQSNLVTNRANRTWEWGNYVCVQGSDGMLYYYCHMDSRAVSAGDTVQEGDKLGVMGNTGYSFGAHLHFEVRNAARTSMNPCTLLGIPNSVGIYEDGIAPQMSAASSDTAPALSGAQNGQGAAKTLRVFGGAKGINVQAFTGRDVKLVANNTAGAQIRVPDGTYPVLSREGETGGYSWLKIDFKGKALYMPYGGVLSDRCSLE